MRTLVRFPGDGCGYVLDPADVPPEGSIPTGWVTAEIGRTGVRVRIDLAKCYSLEPWDDDEALELTRVAEHRA
jgi:hypothetical protein